MDDFNKKSTPQPPYWKPENRVAGDAGSGAGTAARMKLADKAADMKDRVTDFGRKARRRTLGNPSRQDRNARESVERSSVRQNSRCRIAPRFLWTGFLLLAAVYALTVIMSTWLAALIVGAVLAVIASISSAQAPLN